MPKPNIRLKTPKGWRKGQTISNFIQWLEKRTKNRVDIFYLPDKDFDKYFGEFYKEQMGL